MSVPALLLFPPTSALLAASLPPTTTPLDALRRTAAAASIPSSDDGPILTDLHALTASVFASTASASASSGSTGLAGLQVGSVSIGVFGFIIAAAGFFVLTFVACFSVGRLRSRLADSPLNPYRAGPSSHQPGTLGSSFDRYGHAWFDDPFERLVRERARAQIWAREVAAVSAKPVFWEAGLGEGEVGGEKEKKQESLPLAARLLPLASHPADPNLPGARRLSTAVFVRLPCPPSPSRPLASPRTLTDGSQPSQPGADDHDGGRADDAEDEEEEDLPEFALGVEVRALEGEWT